MEILAKHLINAPAEFVYDYLTDFGEFESVLLSLGAYIERRDNLSEDGIGMKWAIEGDYRGKFREVELTLVGMAPPEMLAFESNSKDLRSEITVDLTDHTDQTSLELIIAPFPKTISAKLIFQSVKLAKKAVEGRLTSRLGDLATQIEAQYQASQVR